MKLGILNTSIVTSDGTYELTTIPTERAIAMVAFALTGDGIDSAVSHPSTAVILSEILGVEIPVNPQLFAQQPGQAALVFKLNGRPANGVELTREDLERIGFTFKVLRRLY